MDGNLAVITATTEYPKEYFDFTGGIDLDDEEIQGFIKEGLSSALKKMKEHNLTETFFSTSTGNTKVFGEVYRQDADKVTVYVNVSKGYKQWVNCNIEL